MDGLEPVRKYMGPRESVLLSWMLAVKGFGKSAAVFDMGGIKQRAFEGSPSRIIWPAYAKKDRKPAPSGREQPASNRCGALMKRTGIIRSRVLFFLTARIGFKHGCIVHGPQSGACREEFFPEPQQTGRVNLVFSKVGEARQAAAAAGV